MERFYTPHPAVHHKSMINVLYVHMMYSTAHVHVVCVVQYVRTYVSTYYRLGEVLLKV